MRHDRGVRSLTIVTTGRTSGIAREVRLYGFDDGDRLVIVGSNGGKPADPAWVGNLRTNPAVRVRVGRQERAMRARELHDEERERCWELAATGFPLYRTYARRTDRRLPVFLLEPAPAGTPGSQAGASGVRRPDPPRRRSGGTS